MVGRCLPERPAAAVRAARARQCGLGYCRVSAGRQSRRLPRPPHFVSLHAREGPARESGWDGASIGPRCRCNPIPSPCTVWLVVAVGVAVGVCPENPGGIPPEGEELARSGRPHVASAWHWPGFPRSAFVALFSFLAMRDKSERAVKSQRKNRKTSGLCSRNCSCSPVNAHWSHANGVGCCAAGVVRRRQPKQPTANAATQ